MLIKLQSPNLNKQKIPLGTNVKPIKEFIKSFKKSKHFTEEEKICIVVNGQSVEESVSDFCDKEGISQGTFEKWTRKYLINNQNEIGSKSIVPVRCYKDIIRIVSEVRQGDLSVTEICRIEGITQDMFLEWCWEIDRIQYGDSILKKINHPNYLRNRNLIEKISNLDVYKYLENFIDFTSDSSLVLNMSDLEDLKTKKCLTNIVNLEKINNRRYVNKSLEYINSRLECGGYFIGCMETFSARKERLKINRIAGLNNVYFAFDFLFKRVIPKVSLTKKYYFDLTKGSDRLMSKAEGLGRLVSCGFEIKDLKSINGLLYFVVKKIREPYFDTSPSYGPLYKMPRLGKNGDIIGVYKFRTMHPYSEYLQDYIIRTNGYAATGKPADDFRIPKWGKLMRKYWLDEIPQLINVMKGEMKLVGIRPVSKRYFQDIPKEMQTLRLTQKPGCIPPYVSLNRSGNVMSVLQSEKEYLEEKLKNPFITDVKYFYKAIVNIVFKNKRSA